MAITWEFFAGFDSDEVEQNLRDWERKLDARYEALGTDEYFTTVTSKQLNVQSLLQALPSDERKRFMREYERIIGLKQISDQVSDDLKQGDVPSHLGRKLATPKRGRAPVSLDIDPRFLDTEFPHPLAVILNNMTPQLDAETGELRASSNILRYDWMQEMANQSPLERGKTALIFDTETAGLHESSGIRQISWGQTEVNRWGYIGLARDQVEDVHFRTAQMPRGMIAGINGIATQNMEDVVGNSLGAKGFANARPGEGADFAQSLRPFLEQLRDTDYVIGQNIAFDLNQVFKGLRLTKAYQENTNGIAQLVDEVTDATFGTGKIRDTLLMARKQLPGLGIADELSSANKLSAYSIENLMLKTNLFEYIMGRNQSSEENVRKLLGLDTNGLHSADVDTILTSYLYDALEEQELRPGDLGFGGIRSTMRAGVIKSYGMTPITKITDASHVDRRIFERMLNEDGAIQLNNSVIDMDTLRGMGAEGAYNRLLKDDVAAKFDLTPLEQKMLLTRGDITTNTAPIDTWAGAYRFGKFQKYSGMNKSGEGFLNRAATLFKKGMHPGIDDFENLRKDLQRAGMPFANISEEEMWFTHGIALSADDATRGGHLWDALGPVEQRMVGLTDDLGISRFEAYKRGYVTKSGRNINLNPLLIQDAEEAGVLRANLTNADELTMLDYSTFEYEGKHFFNVQHSLDESEAEKLANYIRNLDEEDIARYFDPKVDIDRLTTLLPEVAKERGIGIANLEGRAATRAYNVVKSFNVGQVSDDAVIRLRAGLMSPVGTDRIVRTGAWISDKFPGSKFMDDYAESMKLASTRLEDLRTKGAERGFFDNMERAKSLSSTKFIERTMDLMDVAKPYTPWAFGAAAVAGVGYYLGKRHQEKEQYRPTMDTQSYESRSYGPLDDIQNEQVFAMRQGLDPLKTAGVVGSQYNNRIGHTRMGPNKNSHLYGG